MLDQKITDVCLNAYTDLNNKKVIEKYQRSNI